MGEGVREEGDEGGEGGEGGVKVREEFGCEGVMM